MYLLCVKGNFANGRIGELNFITYILRLTPTSVLMVLVSSAFYSLDFDRFTFPAGLGSDSTFSSIFSACSLDWAVFDGLPLFFG